VRVAKGRQEKARICTTSVYIANETRVRISFVYACLVLHDLDQTDFNKF
jgi:hypothetical protein